MSTVMFVVLTGIVFFLITCIALLDIARKDFGSIHPDESPVGIRHGLGAVYRCVDLFPVRIQKG